MLPRLMAPMATQAERLASLEQRMKAADEERGEILRTVKAIESKITLSRGAMIGAVAVLSAIGGLGMLLVNHLGALLSAGPPPR